MSNSTLKEQTIHSDELTQSITAELLDSKIDILKVTDLLSKEEVDYIKEDMARFHKETEGIRLDLPDGYFYPYPYSSVRKDHGNPEAALEQYLSSNNQFKSLFFPKPAYPVSKLITKLEKKTGAKLLKLPTDKKMASIGFRILHAQKNGIDIHCENAFLNQLDDTFKQNLYDQIDLEDAISVFITLQSPDDGGELVLYNKEWKDTSININQTSYEERHDIEGSIFTNRNYPKPEKKIIKTQNGSAVMFRAAQIWHCINFIKGNKDRITIGCFIAKGKDGNSYYWA